MQISDDTCEDACAPQKHREFERQTSFSGLLEDTVRTSVTKVAQLIFLQTLEQMRDNPACIFYSPQLLTLAGVGWGRRSWSGLAVTGEPKALHNHLL